MMRFLLALCFSIFLSGCAVDDPYGPMYSGGVAFGSGGYGGSLAISSGSYYSGFYTASPLYPALLPPPLPRHRPFPPPRPWLHGFHSRPAAPPPHMRPPEKPSLHSHMGSPHMDPPPHMGPPGKPAPPSHMGPPHMGPPGKPAPHSHMKPPHMGSHPRVEGRPPRMERLHSPFMSMPHGGGHYGQRR